MTWAKLQIFLGDNSGALFVAVAAGLILIIPTVLITRWMTPDEYKKRRKRKNKLGKLQDELNTLEENLNDTSKFLLYETILFLMTGISIWAHVVFQFVWVAVWLFQAQSFQNINLSDLRVHVTATAVAFFYVFWHIAWMTNRIRKVAFPAIGHRRHLEKRIEELKD